MARGYIVELGELGHLSVSLKCTQKVMTKKEIRSESICFDNIATRQETTKFIYYSPQKVMTKKEIRSESICFDNVHLRTSKILN